MLSVILILSLRSWVLVTRHHSHHFLPPYWGLILWCKPQRDKTVSSDNRHFQSQLRLKPHLTRLPVRSSLLLPDNMAFTLFMVLKIDAKGFSLVATCQFKPKVFGWREKGEGSVHLKEKAKPGFKWYNFRRRFNLNN